LSVGKELGQEIRLEISPPHWHIEHKGRACMRDVAECEKVPDMTRIIIIIIIIIIITPWL
jgi:hypothetical protein